MNPKSEAFFLSTSAGQRFCLYHPAANQEGATSRGHVVYIHPLAEEMNKARRMAALQARALAIAGFDVIQIDLLGCGDSAGDFGDASWAQWVSDVVTACKWLDTRTSVLTERRSRPPLWLWGLRAGCLLATQAAEQMAGPCNFIFWAPAPSGKLLLQQFLRLRAAADMLGGHAKGVTDAMREQLASGNAVEVAGYALSPALAQGLEKASLVPPHCMAETASEARVEWFELSTRDDAMLNSVAAKTSKLWSEAGFQVHTHMVNGSAFWQTSEITEAPDLITATVVALSTLQPQIAA